MLLGVLSLAAFLQLELFRGESPLIGVNYLGAGRK
jgi:hypothetical protein